jgi:hypothetical protein
LTVGQSTRSRLARTNALPGAADLLLFLACRMLIVEK